MDVKIAHLVIYKHNKAFRKLAIKKGLRTTITIGKQGYGSVIDLDSLFVSRKHAEIIVRNETELFVRDTQSTNGTYVNGRKVVERKLENEDVVSFGDRAEYKIIIQLLKHDTKEPTTPDPDKKDDKHLFKHEDLFTDHVPDGVDFSDPHSTGDLATLLEYKDKIVIGRSKNADIHLSQLTITRQHAEITKEANGTYQLKDLGSKNGTFVNGKRITTAVIITEDDDINIGAFKFRLKKPAEDIRSHIAITATGVTKTVNNGKLTILRDVSFQIPSQEFVAIMGPSGCGKSTLLRALNGDFPASSGKVYIHDMELYENYDYLKRLIGYVPQDDIVHGELTVEKSLFYAAKLRLSGDVTTEDIWHKIDEVLANLNINDPEIRKRKIKALSGGQRKRVSIAVELLTDPSILFLDEPTSPLDPETIEDFLVCIQDLAKKGTTVLMVTHKPNDLYYVDNVIFLAKGGYMTFYGNKKDLLPFFDAKNVIEVYSKNGTIEQGIKWADKQQRLNPHREEVNSPNKEIEKRRDDSFFKQLYWLTARYFNIKTNDRTNTLILLLQAPIIAGLIAMIFDELTMSVLFLMTISAIWFGANNSAKEIVDELPIYRRERMFNLRILPYILSKIIVLTFFSAIQVFVFVGIIYYMVGNDLMEMQSYLDNVWMMLYLAFSATLLGLLVSALVNSTEKVMTVIPIVLIPQIMLAGVITTIPKKSAVEFVSYGMLSRWGTEGFAYVQDSIRNYMTAPTNPDSIYYVTIDAVGFLNLPNTIGLSKEIASNYWSLTLINAFVFLGIMWALKRKDSV